MPMSKNILSNKPDTLTTLQYIRMLAGYPSIAAAARKLKWPYLRLQKLEAFEHRLSAADACDLWELYKPKSSLADIVSAHTREFQKLHVPRKR